jgi:hypothetical protein
LRSHLGTGMLASGGWQVIELLLENPNDYSKVQRVKLSRSARTSSPRSSRSA